jgi:hypothetical protein
VPEGPRRCGPYDNYLTPPRPVLACTLSDDTEKHQSCKNEGPLTLERSKTVDEEISSLAPLLETTPRRQTNHSFGGTIRTDARNHGACAKAARYGRQGHIKPGTGKISFSRWTGILRRQASSEGSPVAQTSIHAIASWLIRPYATTTTAVRFACQQENIDMLKKSILTVAGLALGALALQAPARADATVKAGMMTCHVASGWGFVFGSSRDLHCVYSGSNGRTENYTGKISKFGIDIGYLKSGVLVWAVLAPSSDLSAGALTGDYGGVTAGATAGIGGNANVLIGGSTKSISLQPVSVEGDKGINVAAGIAAITLKSRS